MSISPSICECRLFCVNHAILATHKRRKPKLASDAVVSSQFSADDNDERQNKSQQTYDSIEGVELRFASPRATKEAAERIPVLRAVRIKNVTPYSTPLKTKSKRGMRGAALFTSHTTLTCAVNCRSCLTQCGALNPVARICFAYSLLRRWYVVYVRLLQVSDRVLGPLCSDNLTNTDVEKRSIRGLVDC
jgi:hypothetical protein